ncbi:MAG: hypothetical protein JXR22_02160 [Prolixibacteraceae bacterium]|nr:hypothetical protein [Prolixibacteraceae bacterium]
MDNFFDNQRILKAVWKWKIHIIIVLAVTIVLSAIISGPLFIEPKFKSLARIYPVNISEASEESESEHLLEILQSSEIKFKVIEAFRLYDVYKISKDEKLYQTYMLYEYDQNISYKKTEFDALEIKVLDPDPVRACAICDSIIVYLNNLVHEQRSVKHVEFAQINKVSLDRKKAEIDSLNQLIDNIRQENGIIDYFQVEMATQGLMDAAARGGDRRPAQEMLNKLVDKGGELRKHQEMLEQYEIAADTLQLRYDYNLAMAQHQVSYSRIIERPFVADKKAYPIRWLIVFLAAFTAGFISLIAVSLIEYFREVK